MEYKGKTNHNHVIKRLAVWARTTDKDNVWVGWTAAALAVLSVILPRILFGRRNLEIFEFKTLIPAAIFGVLPLSFFMLMWVKNKLYDIGDFMINGPRVETPPVSKYKPVASPKPASTYVSGSAAAQTAGPQRKIAGIINAAKNGNIEDVRKCIDAGEPVDCSDAFGFTPLIWAISNKKADVAELLLEKGADPDILDNSGLSALSYAVMKRENNVIRSLINKGADVHVTDNSGDSVLGTLAICGELEMVKLLVEKGADVNDGGKNGRTPLELARKRDREEVIEFLKSKGAR